MSILKYILTIILTPVFLAALIIAIPFVLLSWIIGSVYYEFKR